VEANSTGGQGSRRAVAPIDDDDSITCRGLGSKMNLSFSGLLNTYTLLIIGPGHHSNYTANNFN
jgi:hypothetical protein